MYETNRRHPDAQALAKLAEVFGVSTADLLTSSSANQPQPKPQPQPKTSATAPPASDHAGPITATAGSTTFQLSREEARVILFLRMNPRARAFFESYMLSDDNRRAQLERTWKIINDFQP